MFFVILLNAALNKSFGAIDNLRYQCISHGDEDAVVVLSLVASCYCFEYNPAKCVSVGITIKPPSSADANADVHPFETKQASVEGAKASLKKVSLSKKGSECCDLTSFIKNRYL